MFKFNAVGQRILYGLTKKMHCAIQMIRIAQLIYDVIQFSGCITLRHGQPA